MNGRQFRQYDMIDKDRRIKMLKKPVSTPSNAHPVSAPHSNDFIREAKYQLRREIRSQARALDPVYCKEADTAILKKLLALPEYQKASRIFCFVSRPDEVDTSPIIQDALSSGKTVAVPRCAGNGIMHAHSINDPDTDLSPGMYGIPEPSPEAPVMDPAVFNLILVPCCSCSHTGKRLGFGGGYYDRYLEKTTAVTIVLCREKLVSSEIPTDSFDRQMDIVLTEAGVFRVR